MSTSNKEYGSITPLDALREFSCMRLAARILDLKKRGYEIGSQLQTDTNVFGESVSFKRYYLEEQG